MDGRQFLPYPVLDKSRLYFGKSDPMADKSDRRIRIFNGPRRLEKAMHMLEGIVRGVTLDRRLNDDELIVLSDWIGENFEFRHKHPFTEVVPRLEQIINGSIFDEEERADILWLCQQFTTGSKHFDEITTDLQILHGIMGGMAADSEITVAELRALRQWMDEKPHLHSCWPFDEVNSIISAVLADGKVDAQEHEMILHFFADVMTFLNHKSLNRKSPSESSFVGGICAMAPSVQFEGRSFCFTGKPKRGPKRELQKVVEEQLGTVKENVVMDLDYLVIGADGNECWAYSAYGRKVEQAIEYRKSGKKLTIVHEFDFWDAVEDAGRTPDE